jgi:diguanylate cyclase (GGDEF)-like protein
MRGNTPMKPHSLKNQIVLPLALTLAMLLATFTLSVYCILQDAAVSATYVYHTTAFTSATCLFVFVVLVLLSYKYVGFVERRLEKAHSEIQARAITDPLTGLYNRRGFLSLAEQQRKAAKRLGNAMFLLFADLDGLKSINDSLGHSKGDEAIIEAANVLREVFRESDILARLGGDEFAVIALGNPSEDPDVLKNRLRDRIAAHNSREGRDYSLSMSIGLAINDPNDSASIDDLMSFADALMYKEKNAKQRRNRPPDSVS